MARLEAGLVNPVLTDEDYLRFERKMDHVFDIVDGAAKEEPRPEGEWHPSDELFSALRIQPVVYAKTRSVKETHQEAETGGRPPMTSVPALTRPHQSRSAEIVENPEEKATVVRRIDPDIFNND